MLHSFIEPLVQGLTTSHIHSIDDVPIKPTYCFEVFTCKFPVDETPYNHLVIQTILKPLTPLCVLSKMGQLPIEILVKIASYCDLLPSLLCLLILIDVHVIFGQN